MRRVIDQVDASYLEQPPPRPLPPAIVLNVLGDHLFERPIGVLLDPVFIISVVALVVLGGLRVGAPLALLALLVLIGRIGLGAFQIGQRLWSDLLLLRNGLILRAHVLRMRPHRNTLGEIDGALLDCAIPVAPRRTYVGSIWLSDGIEATRLARQGRVAVLCLPRTPGTWRIIEEIRADVRYERFGPLRQLPEEV